MNNVLEYLEASAKAFPDKTAVKDDTTSCTYSELMADAKQIGALLAQRTAPRRPIAVFMDKSVTTLKTFMGILYAGCFYVLIDPSFPPDRIRQILDILTADIVITERNQAANLTRTGYNKQIIYTDDFSSNMSSEEATALLMKIRETLTDTDPVYCNFTSGSTGTPKGVLICHRSVIDFIEQFTGTFGITHDDILGNQAPFDFDVSVKDIYSTLKTGATLIIIPRSYFMFPNAVVDMLDTNRVTTLIWAVSALCLLNRLHGLKHKVPACINKIMFSGEMMPIKQLNIWRSYYPEAMFVNLYGPTEITCNCTYYILDKKFSEEDRLPIGRAFANERVFLLDADDREITPDSPGTAGELCVAGTALALGYYHDTAATAKAFTQNPLQSMWLETIYRTGDLAYYGADNMLYFAGRKDFQIKHMGHRIELEEIENVLGNVSSVEHACCFFDEAKSKIVAFYVGNSDRKQILDEMRQKVPEYMLPNILRCVEELPLTKNGKTDRKLLKEMYEHMSPIFREN
ncbi:MAG: amino acid adenylation domain-containing protein [Lachnospiraceae bacterium]|nr:amino acid adenylation domain-containing protein [Lachnospiraceae bacterium]